MRNLQAELDGLEAEAQAIEREELKAREANRDVERQFYAEQKRVEDLDASLKLIATECDSLQHRKQELISHNAELSRTLQESIERTEGLRGQMTALDGHV